MIQHIMLWSYKDDISQDERAHIESDLVGLSAHIPVLERLTWGPVVGGTDVGYTHCFVMDFADTDALNAYIVHPVHQVFAGTFRAACALRTVTDVEVRNG